MPIISSDIDSGSSNGYNFSTSNSHLTIKPNVTIACDTSSASIYIDSSYTNNYIDNGGHLNGGSGATIFGDGTYFLNEAGAISEGYYTIWFGSDSNTLLNLGTIFGYDGVYITGATGNYVDNRGDISGTIGIQADTASATIVNSGTIAGQNDAIEAFGGAMAKVTNTGNVNGDILLENTTSNLINSGAIHGDLTFGNGTNAYNGRAGTISGTITGGAGVDTIFAGNDGESIGGGKGHDVLFGGAGADTFDFSSYSAADRDTVHGFSAANDQIQLDHTVFSHLQAGVPPVFAVAAASTGATDFLFYNSATGGLYYDPDASGSHAAGLFAMLDPGLHLTAANFEVV